MLAATDIPDWIFGTTQNRELDFTHLSPEDVAHFYKRSPQSVVQNVTAPTMLLIGDNDLRVPPHQSYYYMHSLKEQNVPCQLYKYPGSGHALLDTEHGVDAYMNISLWMDKYLKEESEVLNKVD